MLSANGLPYPPGRANQARTVDTGRASGAGADHDPHPEPSRSGVIGSVHERAPTVSVPGRIGQTGRRVAAADVAVLTRPAVAVAAGAAGWVLALPAGHVPRSPTSTEPAAEVTAAGRAEPVAS